MSKALAMLVIRQAIKPVGDRQACSICARYQSITQAHHIPSVSLLAEFCIKHDVLVNQLNVQFVWLCPTHHTIWHAIVDTKHDARRVEVLKDMSEDERKGYRRFERIEEDMWKANYALLKGGAS